MTDLTAATAALVAATGQIVGTKAELLDWSVGTVAGGPDGTGNYPFTAADGTIIKVPCPAKIAAMNGDPTAAAALLQGKVNAANTAAAQSEAYKTQAQLYSAQAGTSADIVAGVQPPNARPQRLIEPYAALYQGSIVDNNDGSFTQTGPYGYARWRYDLSPAQIAIAAAGGKLWLDLGGTFVSADVTQQAVAANGTVTDTVAALDIPVIGNRRQLVVTCNPGTTRLYFDTQVPPGVITAPSVTSGPPADVPASGDYYAALFEEASKADGMDLLSAPSRKTGFSPGAATINDDGTVTIPPEAGTFLEIPLRAGAAPITGKTISVMIVFLQGALAQVPSLYFGQPGPNGVIQGYPADVYAGAGVPIAKRLRPNILVVSNIVAQTANGAPVSVLALGLFNRFGAAPTTARVKIMAFEGAVPALRTLSSSQTRAVREIVAGTRQEVRVGGSATVATDFDGVPTVSISSASLAAAHTADARWLTLQALTANGKVADSTVAAGGDGSLATPYQSYQQAVDGSAAGKPVGLRHRRSYYLHTTATNVTLDKPLTGFGEGPELATRDIRQHFTLNGANCALVAGSAKRWQFTVALRENWEAETANPMTPMLWLDDTLLTWRLGDDIAGGQALVEANPGSFEAHGTGNGNRLIQTGAANVTVQVQLPDGSSPIGRDLSFADRSTQGTFTKDINYLRMIGAAEKNQLNSNPPVGAINTVTGVVLPFCAGHGICGVSNTVDVEVTGVPSVEYASEASRGQSYGGATTKYAPDGRYQNDDVRDVRMRAKNFTWGAFTHRDVNVNTTKPILRNWDIIEPQWDNIGTAFQVEMVYGQDAGQAYVPGLAQRARLIRPNITNLREALVEVAAPAVLVDGGTVQWGVVGAGGSQRLAVMRLPGQVVTLRNHRWLNPAPDQRRVLAVVDIRPGQAAPTLVIDGGGDRSSPNARSCIFTSVVGNYVVAGNINGYNLTLRGGAQLWDLLPYADPDTFGAAAMPLSLTVIDDGTPVRFGWGGRNYDQLVAWFAAKGVALALPPKGRVQIVGFNGEVLEAVA